MSAESPTTNGNKRLECDLVMKGGITSGIVYPPLVTELHEKGYSFRNIGGTSAGAIAAAVTAAAEYGRDDSDPSKDGFAKYKRMSDELRGEDFVLNLFQPSGETRPLLATLLRLMGKEEAAGEKPADGKREEEESTLRKVIRFARRLNKILPETDAAAYAEGSREGLKYSALAAFTLSLLVSLVFFVAGGVSLGWGRVLLPTAVSFVVIFAVAAGATGWLGEQLGGLVYGVRDLYETLTSRVPANRFGICNGRKDKAEPSEKEVLTDWLSAKIDDLAGRAESDPPLTFGDLWDGKDPSHPSRAKGDRRVDLRVMTANLSQNQPYVLPFDKSLFIFKEDEIRDLFPEKVVAHMVARARTCEGVRLPDGYHFLPGPRDLPVIFATRLSLSFPVLISMIPLYTVCAKAFENMVRCEIIEADANVPGSKEMVVFLESSPAGEWFTPLGDDARRLTPGDLQPNWFSDGGICSNFPIHFFDAWLPSRPTFGVNLTSQLAEPGRDGSRRDIKEAIRERCSVMPLQNAFHIDARDGGDEACDHEVYLPRPDEIIFPEWMPIEGLGKFLGMVFSTAQNYRDNMQAMLPSYRDRIVQIRLADEEGGLNLGMSAEAIKKVSDKGRRAGQKLDRYFKLEQHQWVRFLVLMKQMEASLYKLEEAIKACPFYMRVLAELPPDEFPYRRDDAWLKDADRRLRKIGQLIGELRAMQPPAIFADQSPMPEPVLRVTPEV